MPPGPPPNDRVDREAFYAPDDEDDGDDYELEPVDPEILAAERKRARAEVVRAETALDIDQVYEEANTGRDLDEFVKDYKFRFQVKHMLMGTAVLAVFLSVAKLVGSSMAALLLVVLSALVVAHSFLAFRDRKRELMLAAKRERLIAMARKGEAGENTGDEGVDEAPDDLDIDKSLDASRLTLRFSFSVREVLITVTVASVTLGMLSLFGFAALAAMLGLVAIAGLVAFAVGIDMPPMVALGWWVVLLLYILVSVVGMLVPAAQ